jgi:hypothetical protein
MRLWPKRRRKVEQWRAAGMCCVCEQDGEPESVLKASLCEEFASNDQVRRAYLVRVHYGDPDAYEVALCIRCPEDCRLVRRLGARFAKIFPASVHMDILFLDEQREQELTRVCAPFYSAA